MFCMGRLAPDPPGANPSLASAPSEANPSLAPDFLKLPGQTSTSHKTKHFSKDMEGGFAEAKDKTSRKCVCSRTSGTAVVGHLSKLNVFRPATCVGSLIRIHKRKAVMSPLEVFMTTADRPQVGPQLESQLLWSASCRQRARRSLLPLCVLLYSSEVGVVGVVRWLPKHCLYVIASSPGQGAGRRTWFPGQHFSSCVRAFG